jgi:hypothetical protein
MGAMMRAQWRLLHLSLTPSHVHVHNVLGYDWYTDKKFPDLQQAIGIYGTCLNSERGGPGA